ncbi:MAG: DUF86 domain-containing protein [Protaetiibacter sp.]
MSARSRSEILADALEHLEIMLGYAERDLGDQLVVDAVCMRLSASIEALAALDPEYRTSLFAGQWMLMWGMRNRIAHGYLLIDATIVEATLRDDVPPIVDHIRAELGIRG